jgi:hypothetical protein
VTNFTTSHLTRYYSVDSNTENEMGRVCGTYSGEEKCLQGFGGGNLTERGHLVDLSTGGV